MGLGTELKEAREAQGLSLDTLQETTKIQKRYLQAIEQEKFHILPGKFYARAFIKEYANAVGLDPDVLMKQHQDTIPSAENESKVQYTHMQRSRRDQGSQKTSKVFSIIPTIIVVLLVFGIIFFAWYLTQKSNNDDPGPVDDSNQNDEIIWNSDNSNGDSADTNENNDVNDMNDGNGEENSNDEDSDANDKDDSDNESEEIEPEFSLVEEGSGNPPESELDFSYQDDEVTLKIESTGRSWLDVHNESQEALFSSTLTTEESPMELDVSGEDTLYLNIGNAAEMTISINGVEMEYPVETNIVHQKIQINLINETE
ncbi:MAG TPA: RodZ domain-containing protein [Bacillota bacterium]|nr:RodZ domain-containing protein [Bacillota bacterium]